MSVTIVTTTIQPPTKATHKFVEIADKNEWPFIIVGDTKTPHDLYHDLQKNHNVVYLDPNVQANLYPELSDIIGWKSIQRRNIGFVYAYQYFNSDWIATVDDDNIPYDRWGEELGGSVSLLEFTPPSTVYDPIACMVAVDRETFTDLHDVNQPPPFWHRGFPLELRDDRRYTYRSIRECCLEASFDERHIGVWAPMWDGDPDIDALARLTYSPDARLFMANGRYDGFYSPHTFSPFNSQNTFIRRDLIPYYAVLPHIGRMDDIWGGYHLEKIMFELQGTPAVAYHTPTVVQERNPQDLVTNLEKEIIGYRHTLDFINEPLPADWSLPDVEYIPTQTKEFYDAYRRLFD